MTAGAAQCQLPIADAPAFAMTQAPPDAEFNPLARYEGALRILPLSVGITGIAGTLLNRVASGVGPTEVSADLVALLRTGSCPLVNMCKLSCTMAACQYSNRAPV